MHVILRRYEGAAQKAPQVMHRVGQGLVPILKAAAGFRGYAAFASEQGDLVSCSVFDDAAAAARSNEQARGWVQADLGGVLDAPPQVTAGDVMEHALAEPQSGGHGQSLYCMIRRYEGAPPEAEARPLVEKVLGGLRKGEGFRGAYVVRDPQDASRLTSVLFCDSRESAERLFREVTQAAMPPGMSQRIVASGQTAVLAMA